MNANSAFTRVTVVTEDRDDAAALERTGRSLAAQTLRTWRWILTGAASIESSEDPRLEVSFDPVRARAMNAALERSDRNVVLLDAGATLAPTTLEKWAWLLESSNAVNAVGEPGENGALMMRRETAESLGGLDKAYSYFRRSMRVWRVPFTGNWCVGVDDLDYEPLPLPVEGQPWLDLSLPDVDERESTRDEARLLLISPWMTAGGSDTFNLDLLGQLRAIGWNLTVATTLAGPHPLYDRYAELTPDLFPLAHFLALTDYPRFLAYLIRTRRPNVVLISNSEFGYRMLPYLRSEATEPLYLDFCHSAAEGWNHGGYPRLSVEYGDALDLTIVSSEHLRAWMIERGGDQERIEVCYTNSDTNTFRPDPDARTRVRDELGLNPHVPTILFAGRISPEKQPRVVGGACASSHGAGVTSSCWSQATDLISARFGECSSERVSQDARVL